MYFMLLNRKKIFAGMRSVHCVPWFKLIMYVRTLDSESQSSHCHCTKRTKQNETNRTKRRRKKMKKIEMQKPNTGTIGPAIGTVEKQVGWGSVNLVQISFKDLPFFIKSSLTFGLSLLS